MLSQRKNRTLQCVGCKALLEHKNLHFELMPLNDALFKDTNPAPVKVALGLMGKITPKFRLPLGLPSAAIQQEVRGITY